MAINICHDHLGGFDEDYFSQELNRCSPGQVQVEYILPNHIRALYPHLEIQFSAFIMARNNHFESFLNIFQPRSQERTNFLCSFNRSDHVSRSNFMLGLFLEGFYTPEYCSKHFKISETSAINFVEQLPEEKKSTVSLPDLLKFAESTKYHSGKPYGVIGQIRRDLIDLSSMIQQSFITAVAETVADSYVPFPTEKICLPIANKSLWLAYAQPGYYEFIKTYMGLEPFVGIDYSFDKIQHPFERLMAFMAELRRLHLLSPEKKVAFYKVNNSIIEHNFDVLTSGKMIANLWRYDESFEHYTKFGNFSKIASQLNSDLVNQLTTVIKFFVQKENNSPNPG